MTNEKDPFAALRQASEEAAAKIDAASGPLKRVGAAAAQLALSTIPADAACHCVCNLYEPHQCDGWSAADTVREVPQGTVFGMQMPPLQVPMCHACAGVELRTV